jgi:hypothetical protein
MFFTPQAEACFFSACIVASLHCKAVCCMNNAIASKRQPIPVEDL